MRVSNPIRAAIVFAFLVAALAAVTISSIGTHAAAPAKVAAKAAAGKIEVKPTNIVQLSDGNFATTVYGQGLKANSYYKLSDNNTTCEDSINGFLPNVLTDLNGRFAYSLVGNVGISGPCRPGTYTVKAVGSGAKSTFTAKFTLTNSKVFTASAAVQPGSVVSLSDGSFEVVVNVRGLTPSTTYYIQDDTVGCTTSYNDDGPFSFTTDSQGNAELVLNGGPTYQLGSGPCHPSNNTEVITDSSSTNVAEATWSLQPAHV